MTTEEMQNKIESQIPNPEEVLEKIDKSLAKKKRQLIFQFIINLIKFLVETAIIVAVIWLCVKQCS